MAKLGKRITKLEATRPNSKRGLNLDDLTPAARAAMAAAYGDCLASNAPDPDTYYRALLARISNAQAAGDGMAALASADLAAILAAYDKVNA